MKTWLTRILVTQVARWRRSRRGKTALSIQAIEHSAGEDGVSADWIGVDCGRPGGGDHGERVAQQVDVRAALLTLSPEHREVLVLREYQGLAYEEIAEVLEVPRGTVESRLHRARAELRGKLKSYLP